MESHVPLPRTADRYQREPTYCKLLRAVAPNAARTGFDFDGVFFKCGERVAWPELRREGYPSVPVLLEFAGSSGRKIELPNWGHKLKEHLYILWRWDAEREDWAEIARTTDAEGNWTWSLEGPARAALTRPVIHRQVDAQGIARRVAELLDAELRGLEADDQARVLSALHDQLGGRIAARRAA